MTAAAGSQAHSSLLPVFPRADKNPPELHHPRSEAGTTALAGLPVPWSPLPYSRRDVALDVQESHLALSTTSTAFASNDCSRPTLGAAQFVDVLSVAVRQSHVYPMHYRVVPRVRISKKTKFQCFDSSRLACTPTASISDPPPGRKFSSNAGTYSCWSLYTGCARNLLHRLRFLGSVSIKRSVVAMSVSPTPIDPVFLAWRS